MRAILFVGITVVLVGNVVYHGITSDLPLILMSTLVLIFWAAFAIEKIGGDDIIAQLEHENSRLRDDNDYLEDQLDYLQYKYDANERVIALQADLISEDTHELAELKKALWRAQHEHTHYISELKPSQGVK